MPSDKLPIVDAHAHVFDSRANVHRFLDEADPTMEALVGDYSALPRRFLLDDYLAAAKSCEVSVIVCHEYLSQDPIGEMRWLQQQADASPVPVAIVALVDCLDPRLEDRLEAYAALPAITAVREHLGWDAGNDLRRFARRNDLLSDPRWLRGLRQLAGGGYKCGLEVFGPQLGELLPVIRENPDIGFTVAVMGWPLDLSPEGFERWRRDMLALARCENACASVSAVECVLGMGWSVEMLRPWLLSIVESFGPRRVMLGSHMPITTLSRGFEAVYAAYREIVAKFSADERDRMFRGVAAEWFGIKQRPLNGRAGPARA